MACEREKAMRLGLFMMPVHPPHRPMHETLAEDLEKSLLADRLGFDEMFLGEHYSASTEPYPSPLMFMASLIPRTSKLAFGTGVLSLPNRHPAIIAGEAAQFDNMSRGRFILGIGTGSLVSDFELLGNSDPALRNRLGAAAAETACRYTWDRNAIQMRDLFEKAAQQSSRRSSRQ